MCSTVTSHTTHNALAANELTPISLSRNTSTQTFFLNILWKWAKRLCQRKSVEVKLRYRATMTDRPWHSDVISLFLSGSCQVTRTGLCPSPTPAPLSQTNPGPQVPTPPLSRCTPQRCVVTRWWPHHFLWAPVSWPLPARAAPEPSSAGSLQTTTTNGR